MDNITIYTDGACSWNPGPGGWGAILMYKDTKKELLESIKKEGVDFLWKALPIYVKTWYNINAFKNIS